MDTSDTTRIERLSFTTDKGEGARARIGLMVLASDQTMEFEFRALTNLAGVAVYHSRLASEELVTPTTLAGMAKQLPVAAGLFPDYLGLDAIGYGCTSASTIIGEARVAEIIGKIHPDIPSTNPLTAAKAALTAMKLKRIALLTPYTPDVTEAMQEKFEQAGIAVNVVGSFYEDSDAVVGRIDPKSILDATISVGSSDNIDGVFIACTNLRASETIAAAENHLGKPVTASNHALAWHLLRLAGISDKVPGVGQLFQKSLT